MIRLFVAALASVAMLVPTGAQASPVILAGPGSYLTTFTTPVVAHVPGQTIKLAHLDVQPHNVIALDATRPDGSAHWCIFYNPGDCPLFWTPLIGLGETADVEGLDDTVQGTLYRFYCDYHPAMVGYLIAG